MTETNSNKQVKIRLARIKGQLNGLEQMLDKQRDCLEVLNQIAAIKSAIAKLGLLIMENETNCLRIDKKDQKKLNQIMDRFLKTS